MRICKHDTGILMDHQDSNERLNIRCSNACTRAGLTALLLSLLGLWMIPALTKAKELDALLKYVSLRSNLKVMIDELDADSCWQIFTKGKLSQQLSRNWNISRILECRCVLRLSTPPNQPKALEPSCPPPHTGDEQQKRSHSDILQDVPIIATSANLRTGDAHAQPVPNPPTNIQIEMPIWQVYQIADMVAGLGDGKVLALARSFSYRYDSSIYRWVALRDRIFLENKYKGAPTVTEHTQTQEHLVPTYARDELLQNLTMENVRKLSAYEYPDLSEIEIVKGEVGQVHMPWLGISVGITSAPTFVEMGLLFSVI